jgi:lipase chaperone LimK
MFSKTIKALLFLSLLLAIPCTAQTTDDAQKARENYEQKVLEEVNNRIQTFTTNLEVDEFQKEIIKQKLQSYYARKKELFVDGSLKYYERDEKVNALNLTHFSDISNMISEDTMDKIQLFIQDAGSTLEKQNKKKKKKNRTRKD